MRWNDWCGSPPRLSRLNQGWRLSKTVRGPTLFGERLENDPCPAVAGAAGSLREETIGRQSHRPCVRFGIQAGKCVLDVLPRKDSPPPVLAGPGLMEFGLGPVGVSPTFSPRAIPNDRRNR